jgi:cell division protein FtsL
MKRSVALLAIAFLLAVVGAVCLVAGRFERRLAVAQEDMAVLDFDDPQNDYPQLQQDLEKLPWVSQGLLNEIQLRRATLQYWQRHYADLAHVAANPKRSDEQVDPDLQFIVANATYRLAQQGPRDKATILRNLDTAIRAYADALRAGNDRPDAAFNYELALRIRAEIASGKRKELPFEMTEDNTDANMHGDPGEPPKDMKVQQFQIRIPMDPKDFKNSQEQTAGTGQPRKRRG